MTTDHRSVDFLVLGAGLAGTMMARVLSDHYPDKSLLVIDQRPTPDIRNHWALLRFRNLDVARALGVGVEEIEVEKAVYWQGRLHYSADIAMNNTYSLKTYGQIGNRSLKQLGMAKRYLPLTTPQPKNCLWGHKLNSLQPGIVTASRSEGDGTVGAWCEIKYNVCISTLPMDVLLNATAGLPDQLFFLTREKLVSESIFVFRKTIKDIRCSVNQTIYFPESRFKVYRATLERGTFIVEYMDDDADGIVEELPEVVGCFGLPFSRAIFGELQPSDYHTQQNGKTLGIDDDQRRSIIYSLTDVYNLYSVGRFATWRPLRADQLVEDVYKVERMIRQGIDKTKYERRLNE